MNDLPRKMLYFTEVWLYPDGRAVHKRSWSKAQGFAQPAKKKKVNKPFEVVKGVDLEL